MFGEWITAGAAFGIKAFFAGLTFVAAVAAVVGILGMIAALIGGDDESKD